MASSSGGTQNEAAGQLSAAGLQDLPAETLIEIFSGLDFDTFDNMLLVSRRLHSVIHSHWPLILPGIIEAEFSPYKDLFDTFFNVDLPDAMDCAGLLSVCSTLDGFRHLLGFCRAIRRWEVEFPRLRFASAPEYSRSLWPHEVGRLRGALYVWWRFARAFHDPAPCEDNTPEARRAFVRQLSTTQLHEVLDMWETVRKAVGRRVCPSVSAVRGLGGKLLTREEGARVGWGDVPENQDIVDTMMKLRPEDVLHLLVYRHRYATKASVVQFVRLKHPRIEDSVESFSEAILDVMRERNVGLFWPFPCSGFPAFHGGILDHREHETERLRIIYSTDAGSGTHDDDLAWRRGVRPTGVRIGRLMASS